LKVENSNLHTELSALKNKIHLLESTPHVSSPQLSFIEFIPELSERDNCGSNVIAYGFPESTSRTPQSRIANDMKFPIFHLISLLILFRLEKNVNNTSRSLKIIFKSKVEAAFLLLSHSEAKKRDVKLSPDIKFVRDKSKLELKI